ncbi:non-ribosomal peptide synthetase module [Paenibacillus thalictri]|uniref:non-ribosomal peptide synthetase module n=1 Tax=Paenibacillus thalictri TaxID=2527873 RepID=UPI0030B909AE
MRLATEYVKTRMQLTEPQLAEFIQIFENHEASMQVKVLENGNQEVVLYDDGQQEIVLSFELKNDLYILQGSCRITNLHLVNLMRKAVSKFKGSAIVHRIYTTYTIIYHYERGSVVKIIEMSDQGQKLIYEYKDTVGQLQDLFANNAVENEIQSLHDQINGLLDLRNKVHDSSVHSHIDDRLQKLSRRLFVLEA